MTLTGWTWRDIDLQMTLPRLSALQSVWQSLPPVAMQLLGIGQVLGMKREPATAANATSGQAIEPNGEAQALLSSLPTARMPKIMSPEEYLRRRAAGNGATLDT